MKQRPICKIITALFFALAAPAILPFNGIPAVFPHIARLYKTLENFADGMIPEEIKRMISLLNQALT